MCFNHVVHHSAKEPEAPSDLRATNSESTEVTLEWTNPKVATKEGLSYTVSSIEMFSIFYEISDGISETSCTFLFLCLINSNNNNNNNGNNNNDFWASTLYNGYNIRL